MAFKSQALISLLSPFLLLSYFSSSQGCPVVTYWGQNVDEGELDAACALGKYEIINIAFLNTFGNGATPDINLAGHCHHSWRVNCSKYAPQIAACQKLGVKIFLSLGGDSNGTYTLSSAENAKQVASYLWTNYLGGQTGSGGLLGNVVLDGIDFAIIHGGTQYYDVLAKEVDAYNKRKQFYLSAAPQCPIPDLHLDPAIKTGLFDFVWVQFYNNPPCQYSPGNTQNLAYSWNQWTTIPTTSYISASRRLLLQMVVLAVMSKLVCSTMRFFRRQKTLPSLVGLCYGAITMITSLCMVIISHVMPLKLLTLYLRHWLP